VLVQPGDEVSAGDAVARVRRPARATAIDAAAILGVPPERVEGYLVRRVGETVADGDALGERRALAGLQRRVLRSPIAGRLSHLSPRYGTLFVDPLPAESPVLAHLPGRVTASGPDGVVIEGRAVAVAGLAGAGKAAAGQLLLAESPAGFPAEAGGAIVVCAFPVDEGAVRALTEAGAAALLAPGITDTTLQRLGWDDLLWTSPVRVDRAERAAPRPAPPLTVVLLSAAPSEIPPAVWEGLQPLTGRFASALGAEPGNGPELVIGLADGVPDPAAGGVPPGLINGAVAPEARLTPGSAVRVIAGRAEGRWGQVVSLSAGPYRLASEVTADVAEVLLSDGTRLRVPLVHLQPLD
jgi:hypothetical protein